MQMNRSTRWQQFSNDSKTADAFWPVSSVIVVTRSTKAMPATKTTPVFGMRAETT